MKKLSFVLLATLSGALYAQTLSGITLDKPQAQTGQSVQAKVAFDTGESANCGIRVDWGDGSGDDVKINDLKQIPYVSTHTYAKAGDYTVSASPKKVTSLLGCVGKAKTVALKVVAPPAPVAAAPIAAPAPATTVAVAASKPAASAVAAAKPAASAASAASACPAGWTLNAKSVNKKTKAFSCTAKPGTAAPEKKLSCEGDTGYFENTKKGMIGCRV
jgi:hypothetical protein